VTDCLFCKIAAGTVPCHKVWEDENHLAFLTIYPNTAGFTVVIPKKHFPSYAFDLADDVLYQLVLAAKEVAKLIDKNLPGVGRTGMIFEGFGVDHVHAKLFPMHGTANMEKWQPIVSNHRKYFDHYEGYISSHDGERATDEKLAAIAEQIRGRN
jgi:diadenosine tetraphosphate (Ap4A) HIT family hydrolase